jgi:hypothetical protein
MQSARYVYTMIGVMALLPILYFGLRAAFHRKKQDRRRFILYLAATVAGCLLAVAACWGLYAYSINHLPMLVMERAAREAIDRGSLQGEPYMIEGASIQLEGLEGDAWKGAMVSMPKKVMEDDQGRQIYPVKVEKDGVIGIFLFRLSVDEDGDARIPAVVESVEYIAPDQVEERIGAKMTYFDTGVIQN